MKYVPADFTHAALIVDQISGRHVFSTQDTQNIQFREYFRDHIQSSRKYFATKLEFHQRPPFECKFRQLTREKIKTNEMFARPEVLIIIKVLC